MKKNLKQLLIMLAMSLGTTALVSATGFLILHDITLDSSIKKGVVSCEVNYDIISKLHTRKSGDTQPEVRLNCVNDEGIRVVYADSDISFKNISGDEMNGYADMYYKNTLIKKGLRLYTFPGGDHVALSIVIDSKNQVFYFSLFFEPHEKIGFDGKIHYSASMVSDINPRLKIETPQNISHIFFADSTQTYNDKPTEKTMYNGLYMEVMNKKSKKKTTLKIYGFAPLSFSDKMPELGSDEPRTPPVFAINGVIKKIKGKDFLTLQTNTRKVDIDLGNIWKMSVVKKAAPKKY